MQTKCTRRHFADSSIYKTLFARERWGEGWKSPFVPPFHRLSAVGTAVRNEWMHRRVRGWPGEHDERERDSSFRSRIIVVGPNPAAVVYISYRGREQRIFPEVSSIHGFRFLAYRRLRCPIDPREIDVDALSDSP